MKEVFEEIELDYILEEFPTALDQSIEGLQRVSTIVKAMKEFSHSGASERALADLNRSLETTVNVASHEWKYVADDGEGPRRATSRTSSATRARSRRSS